MIFESGACIGKEQVSRFIDKREQPNVNEVCTRFISNWWNYPTKSYFIYLMAKRIIDFLEDETAQQGNRSLMMWLIITVPEKYTILKTSIPFCKRKRAN